MRGNREFPRQSGHIEDATLCNLGSGASFSRLWWLPVLNGSAEGPAH